MQNNLVDKTVAYMKDKYHVDQHVKITIEKNIPIGAGLGGGSADVSATLRGLNKLWELGCTLKELEVDANALGSDTLFCLYNRPAYVYGRGEYIEFLENPDIKNIYLFNPKIEISTKEVFNHYKIDKQHQNFDQLLAFYKMKAHYKFFKNAYNDLHKTAICLYKNMKKYEKNVKKINKNAYMTGSGSTYFIVELFNDCKQIDKKLAKSKLKYIKTSPKN
ncbi:MAG: 4-(cytidine 5'-diphospho)-2-C-methyl-D-erythritol kinase [Acholeplasmataceae bacterium]